MGEKSIIPGDRGALQSQAAAPAKGRATESRPQMKTLEGMPVGLAAEIDRKTDIFEDIQAEFEIFHTR